MTQYSSLLRFPLIGVAALAGAVVLAGWSANAFAQSTIYRCTSSAGVVEYGNAAPGKDQECEKIALPAITTVPAGSTAGVKKSKSKARAGAASADGKGDRDESDKTAKNFPKVEPGTQSKRDNDRNRLLKDELGREEKQLALLRSEYKNGEPDRRGDERNYQRYLDRVEKMKAKITRTEGNVDALRRELASVKN